MFNVVSFVVSAWTDCGKNRLLLSPPIRSKKVKKACWTGLDWLGLAWIFGGQVGFFWGVASEGMAAKRPRKLKREVFGVHGCAKVFNGGRGMGGISQRPEAERRTQVERGNKPQRREDRGEESLRTSWLCGLDFGVAVA